MATYFVLEKPEIIFLNLSHLFDLSSSQGLAIRPFVTILAIIFILLKILLINKNMFLA